MRSENSELENEMTKIEKGDPAPDLTLQDATGTAQRLSEAWRERPLVLAFLRHFG